jgi:AcrR family transcriptional regulator
MRTREDRKARIADLRRQQILDAALTVFSRKGFGESTIPDIAGEAGVAVGTIYNYFESKRDLLISLITGHVLTEPLVRLLEHPPEADDRVFINSLIEERLSFLFENTSRFLLVFAEIQRDPEFRRQYLDEVLEPTLHRLETYLESRASSGAFRPLNARVVVRALVGMGIGFAMLKALEDERSPVRRTSVRELAAELGDLVLQGLEARGDRI